MLISFILLGVIFLIIAFYKININNYKTLILCEISIFGFIISYFEIVFIQTNSVGINLIALISFVLLFLTLILTNNFKSAIRTLINSFSFILIYVLGCFIFFELLISFNNIFALLICVASGLMFLKNYKLLVLNYCWLYLFFNLIELIIFKTKLGYVVVGNLEILSILVLSFALNVVFKYLFINLKIIANKIKNKRKGVLWLKNFLKF